MLGNWETFSVNFAADTKWPLAMRGSAEARPGPAYLKPGRPGPLGPLIYSPNTLSSIIGQRQGLVCATLNMVL